MRKILVDTDILIDYTKGYTGVLEKLFEEQSKNNAELFINSIIVTEFLIDKNLKDPKKKEKAKQFLAFFSFKDITKKVAFLAGDFIRDSKISYLADSYIAATCIVEGLSLATRNKSDFTKIPNIKFVE